MGETNLTGVYLCSSTNGHIDVVDISEVVAYAKSIQKISAVWTSYDMDLVDADLVAEKIKEKQLKRIVIAGDRPGFAKSFFTKAMLIAGNDPENVILASFREHGASRKADTERAKAILASAYYGVPFETSAKPEESTVNNDTLVIGGGITGIQASLEIAASNQKVYLVERTGTIGGHMAMFDKTFPTLDCAACILTPKMVDIGQNSFIDLMTYCEVKGISGEPGNYKVEILKKARRVNLATCIGCGICAEKCPAKASSEFDTGTTLRKSIYIPFPQAVPNKYLIDSDSCTYVKNGKCGVCVKVCPVTDCINLDEKDETVEIDVGNIIVATGYQVFDAKKIDRYGYGKYPNVLTSLEFERLINAAGPTEGNITMRTRDKKGNWVFTPEGSTPKSIALVHCVGSRDENHNKYCSRVCCMYSVKLAHLAKEKLPDADISEYYIDMRSFGKGYEEFYNRINNEDISIIRGRTAKIEEKDNKLLVRSEDILGNKLIEKQVDMVILAVGLEPRDDAGELANMLGLSLNNDGWFEEANGNSDPVGTFTGGITIAGVCQGPKDIPDSVAQGSAAASHVIQSHVKGKISKSIKDLTLKEIEEKAKNLSNIKEGVS